jgi:hypothetical protein
MTRQLVRLAVGAALGLTVPLCAPRAQASPDKPASAQPAVKDVDPIGSYDLTVTVQGAATQAVVTIVKQSDGTTGGTVNTAQGSFPITSVKVAGNNITVTIGLGENGEASLHLVLDGDAVTGDWAMANDGSKITGKKRA